MPSIAKNTVYMMAASVGQKTISLVYFTIIARTLGADLTGSYTAALALTTIFVVFVDLGLTNVFIRESSRDRESVSKYLGTVLGVKILTGLASYVAMWAVLQALNFEPEFTNLVYLSGVTMLLDSLHLTLYGAFRALGNLKYESWAMVGGQLLTMIFGTIFLWLRLPLIFLILAFTIVSSINVLYATLVARRVYRLRIVPKFDWNRIRHFTALAMPFALAAIFGRVYSYVDVVILKKMAGDAAVGFYSTPSKITFAFQFIPLALVAALYPKLSEYFAHDKNKLRLAFQESVKYLALIALPISVTIFLLAEDIIRLIFTEQYLSSIAPLKILIISLFFSFLSFPVGACLNACDRQTTQTKITGIVLVLNVVLNLLLIPHWGAVGAALAALAGNVLLFALGYWFVPQIVSLTHSTLTSALLRLFLASLGMGLAVYYTNERLGFFPSLLAGLLTYPILVLATRAVTWPEFKAGVALLKN